MSKEDLLDVVGFLALWSRITLRRLSQKKKTRQRLFVIPGVKNFLVNKGIEWRFNLGKSPNGGFFKHIVRGVKTCLKKVLGQSQLSFDKLSTILAEIEAVLNSRPLTYSYSDDIEEPITPAHLIIS